MRYATVAFSLIFLFVFPFTLMASLMSEEQLLAFRHNKLHEYEIIYEDEKNQVWANKQCGYEDKDYYYANVEGILWIERQKMKDKRRKAITIFVYHKNKGIDEAVLETASDYERTEAGYEFNQAFEPNEKTVEHAISSYVPEAATRCELAELILARQEFYQVQQIPDRIDPKNDLPGYRNSPNRIIDKKQQTVFDLPGSTILGFEKDGDEWSLNDSYTTRDIESHTVRSTIGNPKYSKYYNSIRNLNYSYFNDVFLRDNGTTGQLPGIKYKKETFWHGNFEFFADVFHTVFEGFFYGAKQDEYYYLAFTKLIEANSKQCGNLLKGEITEIAIEYYTQVTDQMGTYEKDHSVEKIRLKSKYVDSYQAARDTNKSKIVSGFNVDMAELMKMASNVQQYRNEAERFIDLSNCESATTNQLIDNYFRSLNDLPSLQDDSVNI